MYMKKFLLIIIITLIYPLVSCSYFVEKKDNTPKEISVTGRIYFMGSEPFTKIGINAFDGRIYALLSEKPTANELSKLQGNIVTIKGLLDKKINYPQKSLLVNEYKKIEKQKVTGKLEKEGKGINARFYIQNDSKTYQLTTDSTITLGNLLGSEVEIEGYIYEVGNSVENIYSVTVEKKQLND